MGTSFGKENSKNARFYLGFFSFFFECGGGIKTGFKETEERGSITIFEKRRCAEEGRKKTRSLEDLQLIAYKECWVAYHDTSGIVSDITERFSDLASVLESSDFDSSDSIDYAMFAAYFCDVSAAYRSYYRNTDSSSSNDSDSDSDDGDDDDVGDYNPSDKYPIRSEV